MQDASSPTSLKSTCFRVLALEVLVIVGVAFIGHPRINRDLYSAASGVLPVLLVAVILDLRLQIVSEADRSLVLVQIGLFLLGEFVALAITGNRKQVITSPVWFAIVAASLVGLALIICLVSVARPVRASSESAVEAGEAG